MAATNPGDGNRAHRSYLESRRTPFVLRPSSQGLEPVSRLRGTAPARGLDAACPWSGPYEGDVFVGLVPAVGGTSEKTGDPRRRPLYHGQCLSYAHPQ